MKLQERTRDLVLLGLNHVEQAGRILEDLGGRDVVLTRTVDPAGDTKEHAARLMLAVDGRRPFDVVARDCGLGLMEALRQAAPLLAGRHPGAGAGPGAAAGGRGPGAQPAARTLQALGTPSKAGGPFEVYRRIFRRVHEALAAVDPAPSGGSTATSSGLPEHRRLVFDGVRFGADGEVDVARVLANVAGRPALYQGRGRQGPLARGAGGAARLRALRGEERPAQARGRGAPARGGEDAGREGLTAPPRPDLQRPRLRPAGPRPSPSPGPSRPHVGMLKVGLELFTAEGPPVVRAAAALGRPVFLDLKLHDIPATVEGAARSAAATGASLLTVHASRRGPR